MSKGFVVATAAIVALSSWTCADDPSANGGSAKRSVRVAGIVLKWERGDKEANFRRAEPMIREAAGAGAKIVCTTDCFLDGCAAADKSIPIDDYRALGERIPGGEYFERLRRLADDLDFHLATGMLEADGDARYNAAMLIGPDGSLLGKYRKQKLGHELDRNMPGGDSTVFETPFGRVGILICADRTDPAIVAKYRERGAEFLICPSGGMFGPKTNDPIVQARSRETGLPILFVHPAEFLATSGDGSIDAVETVGDRLMIDAEDVGREADENRVVYFDLALGGE